MRHRIIAWVREQVRLIRVGMGVSRGHPFDDYLVWARLNPPDAMEDPDGWPAEVSDDVIGAAIRLCGALYNGEAVADEDFHAVDDWARAARWERSQPALRDLAAEITTHDVELLDRVASDFDKLGSPAAARGVRHLAMKLRLIRGVVTPEET